MAKRIRGGYVLLSVGTIGNLLWLRHENKLSASALRIFLALQEMKHRRCDIHQKPRFLVQEICEITGLAERTVHRGMAELRPIVLFCETCIEFLDHHDDRAGDITSELGTDIARLVPLPRRFLKALASHAKPSELIASLVIATRCLFIKNGKITNHGFAKASWVARVFGIAKRAFFSATAWLRSLRLIRYREIHWRVRNKFGQCYEILTGKGKLRKRRRESAPPYKNKKTISFGNTKNGIFIRRFVSDDLKKVSSVKILYDQACNLGWIKCSESSFLNVVAAAVRANRVGKNPPGLFIRIVRDSRWELISVEQEEKAISAIKRWRMIKADERLRLTSTTNRDQQTQHRIAAARCWSR